MLRRKNFGLQNLSYKKIGVQKNLAQEKFWVEKFFLKIFWVYKINLSMKSFGSTKTGVEKILVQKKCLV